MVSMALTDTIYLREVEGYNQQGQAEHSEPESYKARVQKVTEETVDAEGGQRVASHVIYLQEDIPVDVMVFLPGDDPDDLDTGHTPITIDHSSAIAFDLSLTKITV